MCLVSVNTVRRDALLTRCSESSTEAARSSEKLRASVHDVLESNRELSMHDRYMMSHLDKTRLEDDGMSVVSTGSHDTVRGRKMAFVFECALRRSMVYYTGNRGFGISSRSPSKFGDERHKVDDAVGAESC